MFYAQLNNKGKVYAIQESPVEIDAPNVVPINECDISLLGSYYSNGIFEHIELIADKTTIRADGQDKATITAKLPEVFSEATFKNGLTGEVIATLPVDSGLAVLEITATTPGKIVVLVEDKSIEVVAQ